MLAKRFSIKEAIKFGWETVKKNIKFFVVLLIVVFLINFILNLFQFPANKLQDPSQVGAGLIFLLIIVILIRAVVQMIIQLGLAKITLKFLDNQTAKFSDLFSCLDLLVKFALSSLAYLGIIFIVTGVLALVGAAINALIPFTPILIIYTIAAGAGLVCLLVRFQFFVYFIVDKLSSPIEALKKSFEITKGSVLNLVLFYIVIIALNILGAILLVVGLLVTVPVTILAMAYVYRKLSSQGEITQDTAQV